MEPRTLQAALRVLYTVNNNPQYILAKSSSQVSTILCDETILKTQPTYAKAPLKACLAAVCDSSPELLQDPARDFSLYVLDPLEARPPPTSLAHTPQNTGSPRGVAVALGLMSWALECHNSPDVFVTGTIVPSVPPALEVVFALRETKCMQKPMFHSYPPLGTISAPGPSGALNSSHHPHPAEMSWLSASQAQQTLTRSADFPELYIGPPRRAPGRPEGSTSSKSKTKAQANTFSLSGESASNVVDSRSKYKQQGGRSSKQRTKPKPPRAPPIYSPFVCGPLTRHTATVPQAGAIGVPPLHQQSHALGQNQTQLYLGAAHNPLLDLQSQMPSASSGNMTVNATAEQQAALVAALQGLFAANPHLLQLAAANMGLSAGNVEPTGESKSVAGGSKVDDEYDTDSDIVILDSSAIDTTAFRKSSHTQLAANDVTSSLATIQESLILGIQDTDSSPLPASTPASSPTTMPTVLPEAETPTSNHVFSLRTENGNVTRSHVSDIPATPTPSRTRKRKLDEYTHDESQSSPPPSPSPSVTRVSSSGRASNTKRNLSSPTRGTKLASSPLVRLPSLLSSMRSSATSSSRLPTGSSTRGNPVSLLANMDGHQSTALASGPSTSQADHPENIDAPLNIASDTTLLKRRRTLNLSLNEVMEEHEARKNTKVRKQPSSGRILEVEIYANTSQAGPSRSAKTVSCLRYAQSSPPRPLFRSDSAASSLSALIYQPSTAPGATMANPPATTSTSVVQSASTSSTASMRNPFKNFVTPAWARTNTAMLPRLSEEALARQRAEQEAKKAQVLLRRREAAKAKRNRLRAAECPYRESSDEDDDTVSSDLKLRTLHPSSSIARSALSLPPPPPSLPVFASDAVEPIPSSSPRLHRQFVPPVVPSTPPRKPISLGSAPNRSPSKSGSCSLFTPQSGKDHGSLFTPSTPSITPSLTRVTFTPYSPTVLHRSDTRKSSRKSMPWTPKRDSAGPQRPRSLRSSRNASFGSPSMTMRTPQTQAGRMGMRPFLLPPPSPCTLRAAHSQNWTRAMMGSEGPSPIAREDSGIIKQEAPSNNWDVDRDENSREEDVPGREPDDDALPRQEVSIPPGSPITTRPTVDDGRAGSELDAACEAGAEHAFSPLPPSSPLPASPLSSPAKHHHDSDADAETTPSMQHHELVVPDSDILFPSASDHSDGGGPRGIGVDSTWRSDDDDARATAWFTDSEASAWLTGTDAWLTDAEGSGGGGAPLLADSDGGGSAWWSDSDAIFEDVDLSSSLPLPSAGSDWLSDDADVGDTDGEDVTAVDNMTAFERAFAALVERAGQSMGVGVFGGEDQGGGSGSSGAAGAQSAKEEDPEFFWEPMRPMLEAHALDDEDAGLEVSIGGRNAGNDDAVDAAKVARDI